MKVFKILIFFLLTTTSCYHPYPTSLAFKYYNPEVNLLDSLKYNGFYWWKEPLGDGYGIDSVSYYNYIFRVDGSFIAGGSYMKNSVDSMYDISKKGMVLGLAGDSKFGYYKCINDTIYIQYILIIRELQENWPYEMKGVLSKNRDTITMVWEKDVRNNKTSYPNRKCVFYPFPDDIDMSTIDSVPRKRWPIIENRSGN